MLHNFSIGHEQTHLDRVCYFLSSKYSLLLKDLPIQNLFVFSPEGVVPNGGRMNSPCTH